MNGTLVKGSNEVSVIFESYGDHSFAYQGYRNNDLKQIKKILKENPNAKIEYYNGWIRIEGKSFNGFSKEFIEKTCKLANKGV